jgi:phosphatidylserine decarboxylase
MRYIDRLGNKSENDSFQDKFLKALYTNAVGRAFISILIHPIVSRAGGKFLSTNASKILIKPFVRKNHIDLSQYEKQEFDSYNDFFIRKIKKGARKVNMDSQVLISPCDSKLSVYQIDEHRQFFIKNTLYSIQ